MKQSYFLNLILIVLISTLSLSGSALLDDDYIEKDQIRRILEKCRSSANELSCVVSNLEDLVVDSPHGGTDTHSELIQVKLVFDSGRQYLSYANHVVDFFTECRSSERLPFADDINRVVILTNEQTPVTITRDFFNWSNRSQLCGAVAKALAANGFNQSSRDPMYAYVQSPTGETFVLDRNETRQNFTSNCYSKFIRTQKANLNQAEISINFTQSSLRLNVTNIPQLCGMIANEMRIFAE